jgi:hypothetical protein
VVSIPVFYLLLDVIYAPQTWRARIAYVFGPLKDPNAWAAPGQTRLTYLRDTGSAVLAAIGWGGTVMLVAALILTIRRPEKKLMLLWLPFLSHLLFTTALGGYMPPYFMLPLTPALVLPVAFTMSRVVASYLRGPESSKTLVYGTVVLSVVCVYLAITAVTLFRVSHPDGMAERTMQELLPAGSSVDYLKIMSVARTAVTPGPNGEKEDHRPLFEVIQAPMNDRPQYALIPTDLEAWTMEIKDRPARAALVKLDTNYDYSNFHSFASIGYDLVGTTMPAIPRWMFPDLIAGHNAYTEEGIHIYRLRSGSAAH